MLFLCKFGQNLPIGSEDKSADKKLRQHRHNPHQKQYVPLLFLCKFGQNLPIDSLD